MANQNDVLRVDVIGDFDTTEDVVNTYQFRYESSTPTSDAETLDDLEELLFALYDAIKALWTALVVFRRIRVQNQTTGLLVGEVSFDTPIAGTATGDQGAAQIAGLLSLKTNVPRVVMRKYFPIAETSVLTNSQLSAGAITLMETFGSALLIQQAAPSGRLYRFGYLSPKTLTFVIPLTRVVSKILATQRRRRPGVGS